MMFVLIIFGIVLSLIVWRRIHADRSKDQFLQILAYLVLAFLAMFMVVLILAWFGMISILPAPT